jgi:predicted CXXCH cytochrome family protein
MLLRPVLLLLYGFLLVLVPFVTSAQDIDCLKCHAKLKKEKVIHTALDMGCMSCHTGIDAKSVPHKKTNTIAKGLSADQPDLCYACHDKAVFSKKNVHAAVSMGCTGCHNPHSSKNAKLLISDAPDLCFSCHDKAEFGKKTVHAPVQGGMCISCHAPHSSDEMALLLKKPVEICLECHPDIPQKPHAIAGFSSKWHPVGAPKPAGVSQKDQKGKQQQKPEKDLKDPARPDKPFYCGSCHSPHSTNTPKLLKFNARSTMDLCTACHKV